MNIKMPSAIFITEADLMGSLKRMPQEISGPGNLVDDSSKMLNKQPCF